MNIKRDNDYLADLVHRLCRQGETEWIEFKHNHFKPEEIGEYISALANSAALADKPHAYVLWGVSDVGAIVGTRFAPGREKQGNAPLKSWLLHLLEPRINFAFHTANINGHNMVILEIDRASVQPVSFNRTEYIRIGSVKKPLREAPELQRALWRITTIGQTPFEHLLAADNVGAHDVLRLLDYPAYFDLLESPPPSNQARILDALKEYRLILQNDAGNWDITNLGALLFAKNLEQFATLARKITRVVQYDGSGRTNASRETPFTNGYAAGFERLNQHINSLLPANEVIEQGLRKQITMFPPLAVRELVANALIHQDFSMTGAGPMVEIFGDRIEIRNPGKPLVDTARFVDQAPHPRNGHLATLMRRLKICEDRGTGIDKVVSEVESLHLPAPLFAVATDFTTSTLFARKELGHMDKSERIRACYLHACLQHQNQEPMTNATLRRRFGIDDTPVSSSLASRFLRETLESGYIVVKESYEGRRHRAYLPSWAIGDA